MKRLLIVAQTTGYQVREFAAAAARLGIEASLATDRCHVLEDPWRDKAVPVRFDTPADSAAAVAAAHRFDALVAVGDRPAHFAALLAAHWGLPFHSPQAAAQSRNKLAARRAFDEAGLPVPAYLSVRASDPPSIAAARAPYPCVLKPLAMSASKGVIRADDPAGFEAAFRRIRCLLEDPAVRHFSDDGDRWILIEEFIPGREFAVEGLLTHGEFRVLAVFDKPDPLDGPFFEETLYITPSREPYAIQSAISASAARASAALGLSHGPVHAEVRVNDDGVWVLEAAGRPIGGLCARALRFQEGGLEEILIRHALGEPIGELRLANPARGVLMIPVPREGIYRGVRGVEDAAAVPLIESVEITAKEGQHFRPAPDGSSYPGFVFAAGDTPQAVEQALRRAHQCLEFDLSGVLPIAGTAGS